MLEPGRICVKTAGREAGKYCVIVKSMEENFVLVTGPKNLTDVKRRRCNISHLEPTMDKVKIKSDASDSEVEKALKEIGFSRKEVRVSVRPRLEIPKPEIKAEPEEKAEEPKKVVEKPKHEKKVTKKEPEKEKPKVVKKEVKKPKPKPEKKPKKAKPKKAVKKEKSKAKKKSK